MPPEQSKPKSVFAEADSMSNDDLAARVRDLENALAATRAGMPLSLVPENAAGPGTEFAETWSQAEQEQAGK